MSIGSSHSTTEFPPKALLWPGSLLATIAHAVYLARSPLSSRKQSWNGRIYNVRDSMGSRGSVAFSMDLTCYVAVFYLQTSEKNPLRAKEWDPKEAAKPLIGLPEQLKTLSEEAQQYLHQEVNGISAPVLTCAFWSDPESDRVAASEQWSDVVKHGACLFSRQLLPIEAALKQWAIGYEFTAKQRSLTESLFKRSMAGPAGLMELNDSEIHQLRNIALTDESLRACRESLAEISIIMPE